MGYEDFEEMICPTCNGSKGFIDYGGPQPCDECGGYGVVPDYTKRKNKMNYSTAVMLFNQDIRSIRVSYDPNDKSAGVVKSYIFKTLDPDLKVGDYVTIPTDTRHLMTVGKIEEVETEIDFDSSMEIKWVISRVPTKEYEDILADEQSWIAEMKKAQNLKKKEDIKKSMMEMYQANGTSLETLAIAGRKPAATCAVITHDEEEI